jgi:Raf kinase inhibitor-like YbhB/YbcL family protein
VAARELELLVEDPDAGRFVHWSVLRIPATIHFMAENEPPAGTVQTENGFGDRRWGGPCPPEGKGPHRYVFALYATDAPLGLDSSASADDVRSAISKHAVATGRLTGRFSR